MCNKILLQSTVYTQQLNSSCTFYNRLIKLHVSAVLSGHRQSYRVILLINPLTPNDPYRARTAPLTSKCCILYIYSTNIDTEYFKHGIYSPFFSLQNSVCFIILTYLVPVLFTFYIQGVLKLKKILFTFYIQSLLKLKK